MRKVTTPEEIYDDPNDFYTKTEATRYENNTGMKKTQITLTKIGLSLIDIDKNNKILDIGCGTGFSLDYLKDLGFKNIYGIDPSFEMLKFAKDKGFKVYNKSFYDLLELDQKFDVIISISALNWVIANKSGIYLKNEIKKIAKNIYKITNPNAVGFFQFYIDDKEDFEIVISSFKRAGFLVTPFIYNQDSLKKRKYFFSFKKE